MKIFAFTAKLCVGYLRRGELVLHISTTLLVVLNVTWWSSTTSMWPCEQHSFGGCEMKTWLLVLVATPSAWYLLQTLKFPLLMKLFWSSWPDAASWRCKNWNCVWCSQFSSVERRSSRKVKHKHDLQTLWRADQPLSSNTTGVKPAVWKGWQVFTL